MVLWYLYTGTAGVLVQVVCMVELTSEEVEWSQLWLVRGFDGACAGGPSTRVVLSVLKLLRGVLIL